MEIKFEDALAKLEKIKDELETGGLSLDESLKKFEDAIRLSQFCSKKLEAAEKKVQLLAKTAGGKFELKDFEEKGADDRG